METRRLQLNIRLLYSSLKSDKLKDDFGEDNLPDHWYVYLVPIDGNDVQVLTYNGDVIFKDKDIIYPILPGYVTYLKNDKLYPFPESIKEIVLATATHI